MRVFVVGVTGAIGSRLVPLLAVHGHHVVGTARSRRKAVRLRAMGAEPAIVDALDPAAIREAVLAAQPEAIVHEATALSGATDFKHFDRSFAETNRLRVEGTDALLAAAQEAGVARFAAQSFAGWPYAREGRAVKTETDPLDPTPVEAMSETHAAIRHLEERTLRADGIVLRYGGFYGAPDDPLVELVAKRRLPLVGDGDGVWSFVHLDDAAAATVLALERGEPGVYNVVDDEPAPVRDWLPYLAETIDAKPPRRVPRWIAQILAGEAAAVQMTEARGASNEKAKRELGWTLRYPSWRQGFRAAYAGLEARAA